MRSTIGPQVEPALGRRHPAATSIEWYQNGCASRRRLDLLGGELRHRANERRPRRVTARADRLHPRVLLARGASGGGAVHPGARRGARPPGPRGDDPVLGLGADRRRSTTACAPSGCGDAARTGGPTRPTSAAACCPHLAAGPVRRRALDGPARRRRPRSGPPGCAGAGAPSSPTSGCRARRSGRRTARRQASSSGWCGASTSTAACRTSRSTTSPATTAAPTAWSCPAGSRSTRSRRRRPASRVPTLLLSGAYTEPPQGPGDGARGAAAPRRGRARRAAVAVGPRRPRRVPGRGHRRGAGPHRRARGRRGARAAGATAGRGRRCCPRPTTASAWR